MMMCNPPIRVMLVDTEKMIRVGLVEYLSCFDDLVVVSQAQDGDQALEEIAASNPDVVLLDHNLPELNGVETTRAILEQHPTIRVIVLTHYHNEDFTRAAVQAGAANCILKEVSGNRLLKAIRDH
jgi:DNA-binding NarL/FixJ family response regulator